MKQMKHYLIWAVAALVVAGGIFFVYKKSFGGLFPVLDNTVVQSQS